MGWGSIYPDHKMTCKDNGAEKYERFMDEKLSRTLISRSHRGKQLRVKNVVRIFPHPHTLTHTHYFFLDRDRAKGKRG